MRKLSIISLFLIVAFGLNGCLIDRIKNRLYNRQVQHKTIKKEEVKTNYTKEKIYKPSEDRLLVQEDSKKNYIKKSHKKIKKSSKAKKSPKAKKHHSKRETIKPEPFRLGDTQGDPELLGPQTTLKSNPLAKEAKKAEGKSKNKI
jgi:hypothetical protein